MKVLSIIGIVFCLLGVYLDQQYFFADLHALTNAEGDKIKDNLYAVLAEGFFLISYIYFLAFSIVGIAGNKIKILGIIGRLFSMTSIFLLSIIVFRLSKYMHEEYYVLRNNDELGRYTVDVIMLSVMLGLFVYFFIFSIVAISKSKANGDPPLHPPIYKTSVD